MNKNPDQLKARVNLSSPTMEARPDKDESSKPREPSLLSPVALMALGLAGAATAAVSRRLTDEGPPAPVEANRDAPVQAPVDETSAEHTVSGAQADIESQMGELILAMQVEKQAHAPEEVAPSIAEGAGANADAIQISGGAGTSETALPNRELQSEQFALAEPIAEPGVLFAQNTAAGATPTSSPTAAVGAAEASAIGAAGVIGFGVAAIGLASIWSGGDATPATPTVGLASDTGSSASDGITNVGTVSVGGIEAGASWEYSTNGGTTWSTGTGTSFTLAPGSYQAGSVMVRQANSSGAKSESASIAGAITVDATVATPTVALATDSGISGTDGITNVGTVNVSGIEAGATWQYSIDAGTTWTAGTGTSFTLTGDGDKSVVVRQTDVAGNVSQVSSALAFTLDSTVATPTLSLASDAGASGSDGITNVGSVNVTGLESGSTWQYSTDGGTSWTTGTGTNFTLAGDGTKSATVRQTDGAGNVSDASDALTFFLDTAAPVIQSLAAHSGTQSIDLTFNSPLDAANLPALDAFVISTGGLTNPVASLSLSSDGLVLTLDLTNPFAAGAVSFAYTDATTGDDSKALQDLAGNDASTVIQGTVADGYVRGAQIYIDANGNGLADEGEAIAGVVTDANGNFFLPETAPEGSIIAVGGVNMDTGIPNTLPLKAPAGSTTVNPLTTMVQAVIETAPAGATVTVAEASSRVADALGLNLPSGVSLVSYDPLSAVDSGALAAQKAAAQIATVLALAATAPATGTTTAQAIATVTTSLVSQINTASTPINLADSTTVETLLSGAVDAGSAVISEAKTAATNISTSNSLTEISTVQSVTLDKTAPAAPVLDLLTASDSGASTTDNITNDSTPTLRIGLEVLKTDGTSVIAGDTVKLSTASAVVATRVVTADEIAKGYLDVTLAEQADDKYALTAQVTDKASNVSTSSAALSVTIDTVASAPSLALVTDTGASGSDGITNIGTVNVSGIESGATWQYSTDAGTNWTAGTGTSFTLTGDGDKSVVVRQTDVAGNVSQVSSAFALTLDSTVATPTLSLASDAGASGSDGITNVGTVNVSGIESGATWQYSTDAGTNWTAGTGASFTLTGDGDKSVVVRQTDVAGNVSQASSALAFTLDATVATPAVALATDSGSSGTDRITNVGTVNVSGIESGATWQYSTDAGATWTAGTGTSFTLTGEGQKSAVVRQTDVAGNVSQASTALAFTLDALAPSPTPSSPADGGLTLGLDANLILSSAETVVKGAGTVSLYLANDTLVESIDVTSDQISISGTGANTKISINPSADLVKDTVYHVKVSAGAFTDLAGNAWSGIADATTWNFTGAGATVLVNAIAGNNIVNLAESGQVITITGTLGAEASVLAAYAVSDMVAVLTPATGTAVTLTNLTYSYVEGAATGTWSADVPAGALSGTAEYTLSVTFIGSQGAAQGIVGAGTQVVQVDTVVAAPTLALATDSGSSGTDLITNSGTLKVTGEDGATFEYSTDGGSAWGSGFTAASGANSVQVRQTDAAGNLSGASSALTFTLDNTAPAALTVALQTDTGASGSDKITKDGRLNVTGVENGSVVQYSIDGGSTWTSSFTAASGENTVQVRQTDVAGNSSQASSLTFTLDSSGPTVMIDPTHLNVDETASLFPDLRIDFSFSETVTGFTADDITLVGASKGTFAGQGSSYSLAITPTASTTPTDFSISVAQGAAQDLWGNNSVAANFAASIMFGTAGNDTLTVDAESTYVLTGPGSDVVKITDIAHSSLGNSSVDTMVDFSADDKLDISAILSAAGYTSSAYGDTGEGFVELKNLTLVKGSTTTTVKFDIHFDAGEIDASKIAAAVIDLKYDYGQVTNAQVTSAQYTDPTFGTPTNVWGVVTPNLFGSTANGKIAVTADQTTLSSNPIIDANGKVLSVTLVVKSLVDTFDVGLEAKFDGGSTEVVTADGKTHHVEVGIYKTAGVVFGAAGALEILNDPDVMGTVADNQLRFTFNYDEVKDVSVFQAQFDTNSAIGATTLSDVLVIDFEGNLTETLTPANLILI